MALLTRAIITEFPEHAGLFAMDSVVVGKQKLRSHNGLLKTYEGADGMKTGFICDSGYNVVASATRNNQRLVAVVLGEANAGQRNGRAAALLDYGFQHGFWKTLFGLTTIENMPPSVGGEAKVASIRSEVEAWACGWRKKKSGSATVAAKQQATTAAAATISGAAAAKTNTEKAGNK
jgi:D-alanyl-D-alanine carboxypeptidase